MYCDKILLFVFLFTFTAVQGCNDVIGTQHCAQYKTHCNRTLYKAYLASNCAFTCNRCVGTQVSPKSMNNRQPTNTPKVKVIQGRDLSPYCGSILPSHSRIVGGKNAKPGSSPWQVVVDKRRYSPGRYCAGILIAQEWILTAGHCVYGEADKSKFSIRIGVHDLSATNSWQQNFTVREIHVHPNYNDYMVDYDIALVRLNKKVMYNERVRPACLPDTNMKFDDGTLCKITGWGKIKDFQTAPSILQQAHVPLINHSKCQGTFKTLYGYNVTKRMLCTGHQNGTIGPCDGDSGGPLACMKRSKTGEEVWYAWATISWGEDCAKKGIYSVFANIQSMRKWIVETIFSNPRFVITS